MTMINYQEFAEHAHVHRVDQEIVYNVHPPSTDPYAQKIPPVHKHRTKFTLYCNGATSSRYENIYEGGVVTYKDSKNAACRKLLRETVGKRNVVLYVRAPNGRTFHSTRVKVARKPGTKDYALTLIF